MLDLPNSRNVADLIGDSDELRARCERLADLLTGMTLIFAAAAALVLGAGVWTRAPLFALSAGFAIAAALALAGAAHMAAKAASAAPTVSRAPVALSERRREAA